MRPRREDSMKKNRKTPAFFTAVLITAFFSVFPLRAQQPQPAVSAAGNGLLKDFAFRASGEFAFYRDYTFNEPTWTGILFYDENTWAAQTFSPGTGHRIIVFFKTEVQNGRLVLTGQKNDSNLQQDVPFINYLMKIFPFLYDSRLTAEKNGKTIAGSDTRGGKLSAGLLSPDVETDTESLLFGGKCRVSLSPETPLFNVTLVKDSSGKKLFEFEYGGIISEESSGAFFNFEPVPDSVKKSIAEIKSGGAAYVDLTDIQITSITPNSFFLGENALVLIASGENRQDFNPAKFLAEMAKGTLISPPNSSFIPVPGNFSVTGARNEIILSQIFYDKESGDIIRDMRLLYLDFDSGKYTCAVISGYAAGFHNNEEKLKNITRGLVENGQPANID